MAMSTSPDVLLSPQLMAQLERLELVSRKILRGRLKGERRSTRKGQSVEFADVRNYVHGDDLRFVDWNTYARLDRLFLKLFFEEEDLHFFALIDDSESMGFGTPTKLRFAQQLAAALGFIGLVRGDRVRMETLGQPVGRTAPTFRGRQSVWRMVDQLSAIEAGGPTAMAAGIKNFCLRNPGNGVVVLFSDLMDKQGYAEGLKYLMARRMDVYVIQILSPEELAPDLQGDLQLVDCEDGDLADVTLSTPLLKHYQSTLAAFVETARKFCTRRGINYLLADSRTPVDQLVSHYLRDRGLVSR
jgi:uncharacterized protein (DUF58 family)